MDKEIENKRKTKNAFLSIYKKELEPILAELEVRRRKDALLARINFVLFISCFLPFFIMWLTPVFVFIGIKKNMDINPLLLILGMFLPFFSIIFYAQKRRIEKTFRDYAKNRVGMKIVDLFKNIKTSKTIFNNEEIEKSGLFPSLYLYHEEDSFICNYKSVDAKMSELMLYDTERKGFGAKKFHGVFISFTLDRMAKGETKLYFKRRKKYFNPSYIFPVFAMLIFISFSIYCISTNPKQIRNWIPLVFSSCFFALFFNVFPKKGLGKNVRLEDYKIMEEFNVSASDQIEARYYLSPAYIERFRDLKTVFGKDNVMCSFYQDKLLIAIETKEDLFEIGNLYKPLDNYDVAKKFYSQLSSVYKIIDSLHLGT